MSQIQTFFNSLNKNTLHMVDEFYDEQATFIDPLGRHHPRREIKEYYAHLYRKVKDIKFTFGKELVENDVHVIVWTMILESSLRAGRPSYLDGISYIQFGGKEGKVIYHRDYFDMGEFVYETIPVLGSVIRFIKKKLLPPAEPVRSINDDE